MIFWLDRDVDVRDANGGCSSPSQENASFHSSCDIPASPKEAGSVHSKLLKAFGDNPGFLQEDSGDEEEQERVAQEVQLLMDCVADMVVHEGVQNMGQMTQAGMTLFPEHKPKFVRGHFPDHMGGGRDSWQSKGLVSVCPLCRLFFTKNAWRTSTLYLRSLCKMLLR